MQLRPKRALFLRQDMVPSIGRSWNLNFYGLPHHLSLLQQKPWQTVNNDINPFLYRVLDPLRSIPTYLHQSYRWPLYCYHTQDLVHQFPTTGHFLLRVYLGHLQAAYRLASHAGWFDWRLKTVTKKNQDDCAHLLIRLGTVMGSLTVYRDLYRRVREKRFNISW